MVNMDKPIDRILKRLEEMGMAKTTASKNAGLSAAFIRTLEDNPDQSMSGVNASKLAKILNTTPQWILFGVEEIGSPELLKQFKLDTTALGKAILTTDQVLVGAKIKVPHSDRVKMIAFHYEEEMRKVHNLPSQDSEDESK